jgi:hypothetical protein
MTPLPLPDPAIKNWGIGKTLPDWSRSSYSLIAVADHESTVSYLWLK